jgi:membrane-associated PAP2 superfamily phosphatase
MFLERHFQSLAVQALLLVGLLVELLPKGLLVVDVDFAELFYEPGGAVQVVAVGRVDAIVGL